MMARTAAASPARIARGAAAAAAAAAALARARATPLPPRVFRPSTMPKQLLLLRPLPAASLPRFLPVACSYVGEGFVPLVSSRRSRQRDAVASPSPAALGKDRLVLVTLSDEEDDDDESSASASSGSASSSLTSTSSNSGGDSTGLSPRTKKKKKKRRSSKQRDLVILFGWLGARARDLSKYSEAWQSLGHDTLTARPHLAAVLFPPLGARAADSVLSLARQALSETDGEGGERGVILHVFSNAGFLLSGTCLARDSEEQEEEEVAEEQQRRRQQRQRQRQWQQGKNPALPLLRSRLRGVIFDSCPAGVDEDMALRGISAAARGVPAAAAAKAKAAEEEDELPSASTSSSSSSPHSILSPPPRDSTAAAAAAAPSLRESALRLALRAFLRSGPVERAMGAAWRAWEGQPPRGGGGGSGGGEKNGISPPPPSCPRVYAYSLTDALIPPESVEEVAAAAAARAAEAQRQKDDGAAASSLPPAVSLRVFDSPHCEHLRWHPEEYLELMEGFSSAIEESRRGRGRERR